MEVGSTHPHAPPPVSSAIFSSAQQPLLSSPTVDLHSHSTQCDTTTMTTSDTPSVGYLPLVEGETIVSEEYLQDWQAVCNAAATELPAQGSSVSIKATIIKVAVECLCPYILYL